MFAAVLDVNRHLFVYHETGIDVYESDTCQLHHRMLGTDRILGSSLAPTAIEQPQLCDDACIWGRSILVGRHLIYVSQPTLDRILIISTVQMIVVETIRTDRFPVNLQYVPHLDQVWLVNWRSQEGASTKSIQVVRNASRHHRHGAGVQPMRHMAETIEGQFDQIKGLFVPSVVEQEQNPYVYRYGYVTHENQRGMYKLDLVRMKYTKSIELTLYNCVPENIEFSALCESYAFMIRKQF